MVTSFLGHDHVKTNLSLLRSAVYFFRYLCSSKHFNTTMLSLHWCMYIHHALKSVCVYWCVCLCVCSIVLCDLLRHYYFLSALLDVCALLKMLRFFFSVFVPFFPVDASFFPSCDFFNDTHTHKAMMVFIRKELQSANKRSYQPNMALWRCDAMLCIANCVDYKLNTMTTTTDK